MPILKLTQQGLPVKWISHEAAATIITKGQVCWTLGENVHTLHGGFNYLGEQSTLDLPSIIAVHGQCKQDSFTAPLCNKALFKRDNHLCMYCGNPFHQSQLTRDHVIPRGQGGKNIWTNVVASCWRCNNHKGCRTPEEASMPLLAVPFAPNRFEYMYLATHHVRGDQMEYLSTRFSQKRLWAA